MIQTPLIVHSAPDAADKSGAHRASLGARLADPKLAEDNPCRALFYELLDLGLKV